MEEIFKGWVYGRFARRIENEGEYVEFGLPGDGFCRLCQRIASAGKISSPPPLVTIQSLL